MFRVTVDAEVANTREDGTGVRRVRIYKGQARERLVILSRQPTDFAELPPEIAADTHLIVEVGASPKAAAPEPLAPAGDGLEAKSYEELQAIARELELKFGGVKKVDLLASIREKRAASAPTGEKGTEAA